MREKKDKAERLARRRRALKKFGIIALQWADDIFYLLGSAVTAAGLDRLCQDLTGRELTVGLPVMGVLLILYGCSMRGDS
nr:MAG TPA: hypothetical protein [Caudoviricetes sp.]